MSNSGTLCGLLSLIVFSIAFFNFAGVSITKHMSATTRKVKIVNSTLWLKELMFHQCNDKEIFLINQYKKCLIRLIGSGHPTNPCHMDAHYSVPLYHQVYLLLSFNNKIKISGLLTECPSPRSEVALEPLYRRLEYSKGNQEALDGPSQLEVGALPDF